MLAPRKKPEYNRPWEPWEDEILLQERGKGTAIAEIPDRIYLIAEGFGCIVQPRRSFYAVCERVGALGLSDPGLWTEEEKEIARKYYPIGGAKLVLRKLPAGSERTPSSVNNMAKRLGIRASGRDWSREEKVVRGCYADGKPCPNKRAAGILNVSRNAISYIAKKLDIVNRRWVGKKKWTPLEDEFLDRYSDKKCSTISALMKKAGYNRSEISVQGRRKSLKIRASLNESMSPPELARLLGGIDEKTVHGWIRKGELKASRRDLNTNAPCHQISPRQLKKFIVAHPERIRYKWASIDPTWLVGLLCAENKKPYGMAA